MSGYRDQVRAELMSIQQEHAGADCDGPPSKCTGACRGKTWLEQWDAGDNERDAITCRFCGEDGLA